MAEKTHRLLWSRPPLDVVLRVPGKWLFFGDRLTEKGVRLFINAVGERLTLVVLAARLFESSLACEMAEELWPEKECS